jgi:hypothetical protein
MRRFSFLVIPRPANEKLSRGRLPKAKYTFLSVKKTVVPPFCFSDCSAAP